MRRETPDRALTAALRASGRRVTSQRLVIHRLLQELDRHVTAEEILRRAGARLPGMALPTVYATLDLLVDLGLARKVALGGPALYDPRTDGHGHARCRVCGRVDDLDLGSEVDASQALEAARRAGFASPELEVVVAGVCAGCHDER